MSPRWTQQELANKAEYEGGVGALIDYGISHDRLPDDTPLEILEAWKRCEDVAKDMTAIEDWLGLL